MLLKPDFARNYSIEFSNNNGKVYRLTAVQYLPISMEEAWDFLSDPNNLKKITPESMDFQIISGADQPMFPGQIIQYTVNPLPFYKTKWVTEITHVQHLSYFVDEQRFGPYKLWHHKHFIKPVEGGVEMIDVIDYLPTFGILGRLANKILVQKELKKIFLYRQKQLDLKFGKMGI